MTVMRMEPHRYTAVVEIPAGTTDREGDRGLWGDGGKLVTAQESIRTRQGRLSRLVEARDVPQVIG